jgi:hypothetical protein
MSNKITVWKDGVVVQDIPAAAGYMLGTAVVQVILDERNLVIFPIDFDRMEVTIVDEVEAELPDNVVTIH